LGNLSSAVESSLNHSMKALETVTEQGAANEQRWHKTEEVIQQRLREQEEVVQKSIEVAISKASEVALEAALHAAATSAKNVMAAVSLKSNTLAKGVHTRMTFQRQTSPSSSISTPGLPESEVYVNVGKRASFSRGISESASSSVCAVANDVADLESPMNQASSSLAQFYNYCGPNGSPSRQQPMEFQPKGFQDVPPAPTSI